MASIGLKGGEQLQTTDVSSSADLVLETPGTPALAPTGSRPSWEWRAPKTPGLYRLSLRNRTDDNALVINVLVKTRYEADKAWLEGYHIGHYKRRARRGNPIYAPPAGLIRVTEEMADIEIAPGLTLADFLCHQQPDHWPKYVLVEPRLLGKLTALIEALRTAGIRLRSLTVMSGYRTPWYNADIDNTTVYSRHLYGGAADIFVDANGNGAWTI